MPIDPGLPTGHLDKVVHLCEYLLLAWLLAQAVHASSLLPEREHLLLWIWVFVTSYGLLIEAIQAMIPWRSGDVMDAAANALGAAIGVWLSERVPHRTGR